MFNESLQTEQERLASLLAPVVADQREFDMSYTDEEKRVSQKFYREVRHTEAYWQLVDDFFSQSDANNDGLLSRNEFKEFVAKINDNAVAKYGLKHRDTTDELIDKIYPCLDGINQARDGVSMQEMIQVYSNLNEYGY